MRVRARLMPALVALLTAVAAGFLWLQSDRSQALLQAQVLAQAEKRSVQLADAMGGQVSGLIGLLDLQLRELRREWQRNPQGFESLASALLQGLPGGLVTHIAVADAAGEVVFESGAGPGMGAVGGQAFFRAHLAAPGRDRLVISRPVQDSARQAWSLVVNRPILGQGRFEGTVQMAVSTEALARRLGALELSGRDVVGLIDAEGAFLARSRDNPGAMGTLVPAGRPFLTDRASPHGSFRTPGLLDETPRTYGWHRLSDSGLVVVVGLGDESVLAPLAPAFQRGREVTAALIALLLGSALLIVALLQRMARKESALEASEVLRLRQFESSPLAMLVMDANTFRFIDCNQAALAMYGYPSREALLACTPLDLSAPKQEDGASSVKRGHAYVNETRRAGAVVFEWRHKRPDGSWWDGDGHLMAFELDGRSLMQFTMQDITLRKRSKAALQESEARLREAQRMARVGSWERNLSTPGLTWSDEIFRILEIDPTGSRPAHKAFITTVHPDDRALVLDTYQRSVDTRTPYDLTHRLQLPSGRVKHVRVTGFTQFEGEQAVRSVGTVQDITEVRTAEEALRRLNEELEQRVIERTRELSVLNRELEAFAYSVSHDLRTPLRTIDGFASLLEEDCGHVLSEAGKSHVSRIRSSSRRMGRLISDLLTLAHLSRAELRLEPVDLTRLAHSIAKELSATDPARRVQWQIDEGMQVRADPGLMRVVLQNLLGNAWKYTGRRALAEIAFTQSPGADGRLSFCVRDNGAGFDMTYVDQLFEPFKRLHAHHEFEGSGVGLATVQRVLERHGGEVSGEAVVGQGAVFCFALPAT